VLPSVALMGDTVHLILNTLPNGYVMKLIHRLVDWAKLLLLMVCSFLYICIQFCQCVHVDIQIQFSDTQLKYTQSYYSIQNDKKVLIYKF